MNMQRGIVVGMLWTSMSFATPFDDLAVEYTNGVQPDFSAVSENMALDGSCSTKSHPNITESVMYYFTADVNPVETRLYVNYDHYRLRSLQIYCTPLKNDESKKALTANCGVYDVFGNYHPQYYNYVRQIDATRVAIYSIGANNNQQACVFSMAPGSVPQLGRGQCWHQEDCPAMFSCRRHEQRSPGHCWSDRL